MTGSDEGKGKGDKEERGFVVKDRRSSASGEREADPEPAGAQAGAKAAVPEESSERPLPEIDFSTFVLSLSTSALYHLGQLPHPETGQAEVTLPLAKQTIDILGVLAEKTRGNLSRDEDKLLGNLLYDLRVKYVEALKR